MTATSETFLTIFPEFKGYDIEQIDFWMAQGVNQLALVRLGANADLAMYLFTAHNLALSKQNEMAVANGGAPGGAVGVVASQGAGPLSISFDTGSVTMDGAGFFNATSYGQRFYKLMQMAGLGGMFVYQPYRPHVYGYGFPGYFP